MSSMAGTENMEVGEGHSHDSDDWSTTWPTGYTCDAWHKTAMYEGYYQGQTCYYVPCAFVMSADYCQGYWQSCDPASCGQGVAGDCGENFRYPVEDCCTGSPRSGQSTMLSPGSTRWSDNSDGLDVTNADVSCEVVRVVSLHDDPGSPYLLPKEGCVSIGPGSDNDIIVADPDLASDNRCLIHCRTSQDGAGSARVFVEESGPSISSVSVASWCHQVNLKKGDKLHLHHNDVISVNCSASFRLEFTAIIDMPPPPPPRSLTCTPPRSPPPPPPEELMPKRTALDSGRKAHAGGSQQLKEAVALSYDARQEARAHKRLHGYLQGFQSGHAVVARAGAIQRALDSRPALKAMKHGIARKADKRNAEEDEELFEAASVTLYLQLLEATDAKIISGRIMHLTQRELETLKATHWRYMYRCCGKDAVMERAPLQLKGQRLECYLALAAEIDWQANHGDPIKQGAIPAFLAGADLKTRVIHYTSALELQPEGEEEQEAVAAVLRLLLQNPKPIAFDMTWHHVLVRAIRSYPEHLGPVLSDFLHENLVTQHQMDLGRTPPSPYCEYLSSEPLKRLVVEVLKQCSDGGEPVKKLAKAAADIAADEVRNCVRLSEGAKEALTLPKVVVKSMLAPGWQSVMRVWTEDPCAGDYLRCNHGVSILLQCLERSALAAGPYQSPDVTEAHVDFVKLQSDIVHRFIKALLAEEVQASLIQAIAWTEHDKDVWTKKSQRRRLCRVLRRLAWSSWQVQLPPVLNTPLPPALPGRLDPLAASIVLPLPGAAPVPSEPTAEPTVKLPAPQFGKAPATQNHLEDERILALLESARRTTEGAPLEAEWLDELLRPMPKMTEKDLLYIEARYGDSSTSPPPTAPPPPPPTAPPPPPPPPAEQSNPRLQDIDESHTSSVPCSDRGIQPPKMPPPPPPTMSQDVHGPEPCNFLDEEFWPSLPQGKSPKKAEAISNSADRIPAADTGSPQTITDEWKTGDFVVTTAWTSSECWGDEKALSVREGDVVVIDFVDSQGWARSVTKEGTSAWLPFAVLRRAVHTAKTCFHDRTYDDYVMLNPNDRVVVYAEHDDGARLWCYGGRLRAGESGSIVEQVGWFAADVIGGSVLS